MDIENQKPEFHELQNDSQNISKSSGDGRAATYATQLCNRYQNLAATVKVRLIHVICHLRIYIISEGKIPLHHSI